MRKIGVLLALSLVLMSVRADDFGMWTGIGFGQNLGVRDLSADVDFGFRSNNSLRSVDRWSAGFGLGYSVCPYLKVAASYTYMYSYSGEECKEKSETDFNITHGYWRSKNRFSVGLKSGFDLGRFSFSLRERYQLTGYNSAGVMKTKYRNNPVYVDGKLVGYSPKPGYPQTVPDRKSHKSKEYLRSKIEVAYNIRRCPVDPFVSVEFENNLRNAFKLDEVRYVAGAEWKISKQVQLTGSYHFNKGSDADHDDDLNAVELSLKFKNLFGGVKTKNTK